MIWLTEDDGLNARLIKSIDSEEGTVIEADYNPSDMSPVLNCTDKAARYIEELPEIVELLRFVSGVHDPAGLCAADIIAYAEGNKMADQEKRPQPGEWWETRIGGRAYIAAIMPTNVNEQYDRIGIVEWRMPMAWNSQGLFEDTDSVNYQTSPYDLTRHLPGCTGWDWEEPKEHK